MKTNISILVAFALAIFTACEKDGDIITVSGLESSELLASEASVVLTKETASSSVLALAWSGSSLTISNSSMTLPGSVPVEVIEASASSDFGTMYQITPQNNSYTFTGAYLNTLGKNLGLTADISAPVYFRVRSALGVNTEPYYSNVVSVSVTCYAIDMSLGLILTSGMEDTGFRLYSPDKDGEYYGFTGATSWYNWYLQEGDGTTWGNLAVDGNAFALSSETGNQWNMWYPGQGGCYYTTLSTTAKVWTATYMPSLSVSGDVTATMTFDRLSVKWYVSFTTTTDNATIKVTCDDAALYNKSTSTDDASAIAKTMGFITHADSTVTFEWNSASAENITIPTAGEYTLFFYLADPTSWKYSVREGATVIVEPISRYLFLPGVDDLISGGWTFDNYLKLVSEDDSTFAGAVLVNSEWGYQMTLESGNWTDVYKMGATEGTLEFQSGSNITAPAAGLYLIQADLANLTYSHTAITGLGYSGLNDAWSTITPMDETSVAGVYSTTVAITAASSWGFKFYLNGDWNMNYGGGNGVLQYGGANITDDASLPAATYDVIANTRNDASFVFLGDEIYIVGLNDTWNFTDVVLTKSSIGVYTGTAVITAASSYGITIQLDQTWNRYFGGSFDSLTYLGGNITDDQSLEAGAYDVTVDFINNECSFVKQ